MDGKPIVLDHRVNTMELKTAPEKPKAKSTSIYEDVDVFTKRDFRDRMHPDHEVPPFQPEDAAEAIWENLLVQMCARADLTEDEVWGKFMDFYRIKRLAKEDELKYGSQIVIDDEPKMKSLQDLL